MSGSEADSPRRDGVLPRGYHPLASRTPSGTVPREGTTRRANGIADPVNLSGTQQSSLVLLIGSGLGNASEFAFDGPRNFLALRLIIACGFRHLTSTHTPSAMRHTSALYAAYKDDVPGFREKYFEIPKDDSARRQNSFWNLSAWTCRTRSSGKRACRSSRDSPISLKTWKLRAFPTQDR